MTESLDIDRFFIKLENLGPLESLAIFIVATVLMIYRLGAMEKKGFEGTVLGTLIMPYCSGFSNLSFAYIMGSSGESGAIVFENCIVNNVTNLTLLIGLPSAIWAADLFPKKESKGGRSADGQMARLSLLLTLTAVLFFTSVLWALGSDGTIDFSDGFVLIALFLFWQVFHLFEVLKNNVRQNRSLHKTLIIDFLLVIASAYMIYVSIESLVDWIPKEGDGFFNFKRLGWLSGLLMVLPNALLAIYYSAVGRPDIVYSSQVGDGHICIPMCIGIFALLGSLELPPGFSLALWIIIGVSLIHFLSIAFLGRLPRVPALIFTFSYFFFMYKGFF